eukprot:gene2070-3167_t
MRGGGGQGGSPGSGVGSFEHSPTGGCAGKGGVDGESGSSMEEDEGFGNEMVLCHANAAHEGEESDYVSDAQMSIDPRVSSDVPQPERRRGKPKGARVLRTAGAGKNFGFTHNRSQIVIHFIEAALVGLFLRLIVFPQANIAAGLVATSVDTNNVSAPGATHEELMSTHTFTQTSFLISFGLTKAVGNLLVGRAADIYGRRNTHIGGWAFGVILALVLLSTTEWNVIVIANIFLGLQQAITWSTNIFMFTDILGPKKRAVSSALSNCMGYMASGFGALISAGLIEYGGYSQSFAAALMVALFGFVLGAGALKDTLPFVAVEVASEALGFQAPFIGESTPEFHARMARQAPPPAPLITNGGKSPATTPPSAYHTDRPHPAEEDSATGFVRTRRESLSTSMTTWSIIAKRTSYNNRACAVLCIAGLAANSLTGLVWGLILIWAREHGISSTDEAVINFCYTFPKGLMLLVSGLLSDRWAARKPLMVSGMCFNLVGLLAASTAGESNIARSAILDRLVVGVVVMGLGTGMAYPVLGAGIGDHTPAA